MNTEKEIWKDEKLNGSQVQSEAFSRSKAILLSLHIMHFFVMPLSLRRSYFTLFQLCCICSSSIRMNRFNKSQTDSAGC